MKMRALLLALALLVAACDDAATPAVVDAAGAGDTGRVDGMVVDLATPDAAPRDASIVDSAIADSTPADATPTDAALAEPWRILLIGNSYVAFNQLDILLAGLLNDDPAVGAVDVVSVTRGGYRLIEHAVDAATPGSRLHDQLAAPGSAWTAVVLQEQSQIPGFPADHPQRIEMVEGATRLHTLAGAAGAQTVLMLTWGRRDGDDRNPQRFPDFATMQALLTAGYTEVAAALDGAIVAPAGPGFGVVRAADEAAFGGLYTADGSHPSLAGSYLAAAVLYRTLTGRPAAARGWAPEGLADAERLRAWADQAALP